MNINKRLFQYIESAGMTARDFERKCGLSNGSATKIAGNSRKSTFDRIKASCPELNIDWLLTGKGEMINDSIPALPAEPLPTTGSIRYWEDVAATGGSLEFLENPNEHQIRWMDVPNFSDCTDAVNIYGDSMYPIFKNGEIIILKLWEESFIDYGNVYLVVTKNGNRMVKYLRKADDESKVLCMSENKDFDPFTIDKSDILRLFIVKGAVRKDTL